jgi:tRNA-uridine 2-sulfurtransferase
MISGRKTRVVVGMSGGVDSSAAAAVLLEQGYDVVGVTLKLWPQDCLSRAEDKCCGPQAVADARGVCDRLGIPFYLVDEAEEFRLRVVEPFAHEYRTGRTPNPCVLCNEHLKFGTLLRRARQLGADYVATGHYARLTRTPEGRTLLLRGRDPSKDQSYFLFTLGQRQLSRMLFPLGDLSKVETRSLAAGAQLKTAAKEESMEICFVPDNDYGEFLRKSGLVQPHRGEIVDRGGRVLGHHDGIEFFTIGQRRGLAVSAANPLYVLELDPERNRVVVGAAEELQCDEFLVTRTNWIPWDTPPAPLTVTAQIRYQHRGTPARVTPLSGNRARVHLDQAQRAVTPGQACVFFEGDRVLGGGWIQSTAKPQPGQPAAGVRGSSADPIAKESIPA